MLLLMLFALVAGAGTAITPCVLPVMPALLSASATGGRRRPLAIVLGLAITFTISVVALAKVVNGVGLGSGLVRSLAVVVLIAFGVTMLVPALAQRIQAPLSRLARFGPKTRGDGFWSGLGVGAGLGFVCAPCAGPIESAVIAVSASAGGPTLRVVVIAVCYSAGMAGLMLLYGLGGRAVLARVRKSARGDVVERVLGVLMIATGIVLLFNLDIQLDNTLAKGANSSGLVAFLADPTNGLQTSGTVSKELTSIRPASRFATRQSQIARAEPAATKLPVLGTAPNFVDTQDWFNTPGDRPLTIKGLRGHVVLIDFWTYTCINCIRTLPFVEGLYKQYHRYGLEVVGVETPEFTFEQNADNVRQAIAADGLTYPVVQDNRYGTWDAWGNEYWPADYFVDAQGRVRHTQFGEGDYEKDETVVRELLVAAGAKHLPPRMTARAQTASSQLATPETYLNPQRAQGFSQPLQTGTHSYAAPPSLGLNGWALNGSWTVASQSITPAGAKASISGTVQARDVYLVMTSVDNRPRRGRVLLNGRPIRAAYRGTDVGAGGYFTVQGQRLYNLVKLKQDDDFTITVELTNGIRAYDFTFG